MEIFEVESEGCREFFKNWGDIERTLRISYSACSGLEIAKSPCIRGSEFKVIGAFPPDKLDEEFKPFEHVYKVTRHTLVEGPTHL